MRLRNPLYAALLTGVLVCVALATNAGQASDAASASIRTVETVEAKPVPSTDPSACVRKVRVVYDGYGASPAGCAVAN